MPLLFKPSTTPIMPLPCSVSATTISRGLAVAAEMVQISDVFLILSKTFIG